MIETHLYIDGEWCAGSDNGWIEVFDPASEEQIGSLACATPADLDRAVASAVRSIGPWSRTSPLARSAILRQTADLLRERRTAIARVMTAENGKPIAQAEAEILSAADMIEWFAEEGRRAYGRVIPARSVEILQMSLRAPVGVVAAFTPWNFPIIQMVKKLSAALAAGCSVVVKAAEETPASPAALVRAFHDAGLPPGVLNLVFGDPAAISAHLIAHPAVRKISFTGSTAVGRELAALAGRHMKRATMELGGHAPAIVLADADLDRAASLLAQAKFRNAGQVCISPTRFIIEDKVHDAFLERLTTEVRNLKLGHGLEPGVTMGPLIHARRRDAVLGLIEDATARGATLVIGGRACRNKGHFVEPTVLADVPPNSVALHEEVFGPVALVQRFSGTDQAIALANSTNYGLAAYVHGRDAARLSQAIRGIRAGMVAINHNGLALPETPFGGIGESGFGTEGGAEGLEAYLEVKFVSHDPLS